MDLIPVISQVLLYLIAVLFVIVIITVISKNFRKTKKSEPENKPVKEDKPSAVKTAKTEKKPTESPKQPKKDITVSQKYPAPVKTKNKMPSGYTNAKAPKNITIRPKENVPGNNTRKANNAHSDNNNLNTPRRNSLPRFQILNDDMKKEEERMNNNAKNGSDSDNN